VDWGGWEVTTVKMHWCDEQPCPEWGTGPDSRPVKITSDERLLGLFAQWQSDACSHDATEIVRQPDSLGRDQYYERCTSCGLRLSSAISHSKVSAVSDRTADEMEALARAYVQSRREQLDKIARDAAERCQPANRKTYDDYLRSPEWKRRAAKIMERAKGVCEGCLTKEATEVHHLTYEHIGAEFAFELVALCSHCHDRYHAAPTA